MATYDSIGFCCCWLLFLCDKLSNRLDVAGITCVAGSTKLGVIEGVIPSSI